VTTLFLKAPYNSNRKYQRHHISLEEAANLAGVSWAQMKDILMEKGG